MSSLLALLPLLFPAAGEFDVVFNEIHYHPFGNDAGDEFVELHNRGAQAVDLSGWRVSGAVVATLPQGEVLLGGGYLVLSPDPERTARRYGVARERIVGAWAGQLDNDGDTLELSDGAGRRIARVRYRDGAGWPQAPDGFGPSLELVAPRFDFDFPESWAASARPGGTPGRVNSRYYADETARAAIVSSSDPLRFLRGRAEASPGAPLAWTRVEFDDGGWERGPGPLGYGAAGLGTILEDMRGGYSTVYVRVAFTIGAGDLAGIAAGKLGLLVSARYDDGFIAYLEGVEVFRLNVSGAPGEPVAFDGLASRSEQAGATFELGPHAALLREGRNVLSVQGFNRDRDQSGDFLIDLLLERIERTGPEAAPLLGPVLNEAASGPAGFIEVASTAARPLDLEGFRITADPFDPRAGYRFPQGPPLAAGELRAVGVDALGFAVPSQEARYLLLDPDGNYLAGLDAKLGPLAGAWGLVPDGEGQGYALLAPSPGGPNQVQLERSLVINEIHYHPRETPGVPEAEAREEFIELWNIGPEPLDLAGYRFTRGIDYIFAARTVVPAGGYLVLAADPQAFRARRGLPEGAVVGGYLSRLGNDSETLRLEDPRGNPADQVRYADDGSWPDAADGQGPSLELANPALANEAGASWRAGPPDGTPGAPNASLQANPPPVVFDVVHRPAVPRPGEPIAVRARASAVGGVRRVGLSYRTERGNGSGEVELRDDGLSGDASPGDGLFGGTIPAPSPTDPQLPARVAFALTAEGEDGQKTTAPGAGRDFLFEIEDQELTGNSFPRYRLIMTLANWTDLRARPTASNTLLDATLIASGEVFYNVGLRYRGNGARNPPDGRYSYRVQLSDEQRFHGIRKLNLNAQRIAFQMLGTDLLRRSGFHAPQFWPADVWVDGTLDRGYLRMEAIDGDFLDRNFRADESGGNLYRAHRGGGGRQGDLRWYGADPGQYDDIYEKITNEEDPDWSDVVALSDLLGNSPDAEFAARVRGAIDVEEWCRYFALYAVLGSSETGIYRDDGDDYFLYRRPSDGRWLLFAWDHDSDFSSTEITQPLFRPSSPSIRRFLTHPDFAPTYYCILDELTSGSFSRRAMEERLPLVREVGGPQAMAAVDGYVVGRLGFLAQAVPGELAAGVSDPGGGAPAGELVRAGEVFRYFEGVAPPPAGWESVDFDDAGWRAGVSPLGQGYDPLGTAVLAQGSFLTLYARRSFTVSGAAEAGELILLMGYDDGFVAYLNGVEVARANLGERGQPVGFDAPATTGHDGYPREAFPVPAGGLREGANVLAIAVANNRPLSGDLLLDPVLRAGAARGSAPGGGCGERLHGLAGASPPTGTVRLSGTAPACATHSVRVNGQPAQYQAVGARWEAQVAIAPGPNPVQVESLDRAGGRLQAVTVVVEGTGGFLALQGTLAAGAVWTRAGGPYYVGGDLDVPPGARLEIQAGASVLVAPGASIVVRGELRAEGEKDSPITLGPVHCGETWGGIRLLDSGLAGGAPVHRLRHAVITRAAGTAFSPAAVEARAAQLEIHGVAFQDLAAAAIAARDSRLLVEDSLFREVQAALRATASEVVMRRVRVEQAGVGGAAVSLDGDGPAPSLLLELDLRSPVDGGLALLNSTARVVRSRIHDCGGTALRVSGGSPRLEENLLVRSATGLLLQGGSSACDHLTITECGTGLEASGGASARVASSIIWGNDLDVRAAGGEASFSHSDVGDGEPPPGPGNIAGDPLFASLERYDLAPGSPALGAGEAGSDMGAVPSPDAGPRFVRGDYNRDGELNLTDPIVLLLYLFLAGEAQSCEDAGDADDSGSLDLTDAVTILVYLYLGGPAPPPPFPDPGRDGTQDPLGCRA